MKRYTIPFKEHAIIYKPLRHLAFIGNKALVAYLDARDANSNGAPIPEVETFLASIGYDEADMAVFPIDINDNAFGPTDAVLLMTNRCNLRCIYCYANAGAEPRLQEMDWPTARAAIDFVVANARTTGTTPALTFHGGGEPTVHWKLLVQSVDYIKAIAPQARISMSSNGIWSDEQRRFICRHFGSVSLSMDGVEAAQDRQRPYFDGRPSFATVRDSMSALDQAGIDYGIRITALEEHVNLLPQSVRYILENTQAKSVQIEPTFTSGRGHYADITLSFADRFTNYFMDAWRIGRQAGLHVYYSGARPWVIASMFCLAPLKAAVVTADGRLVTCFEVFSEHSSAAPRFTVGRVTEGRVVYDSTALHAFVDAQQQRRAECEDCFCYWHCCGDCATRRPGSRAMSQGRCRATRNITREQLLAYMEEGDGVWRGLQDHPGDASPITMTTPGEQKTCHKSSDE